MAKCEEYAYNYEGNVWHLINPENNGEFWEAITSLRQLSELGGECNEKENPYSDLIKKQEKMIVEYVNSSFKLDTELFSSNIAFLARYRGLKMAELETALDLSKGYISRTLNSNSNKNMNIDMAWKISRILEAELNTMLSVDMQNQRGNSALIVRFCKKLKEQTREGSIRWNWGGGYNTPLDTAIEDAGIVADIGENGGWESGYDPELCDSGPRYPLTGEIMYLQGFISPHEDLYIIPYERAGDDDPDAYDFLIHDTRITAEKSESNPYPGWKHLYSYYDTVDCDVAIAAKELYSTITDMRYDAYMDADSKAFMKNFLGE